MPARSKNRWTTRKYSKKIKNNKRSTGIEDVSNSSSTTTTTQSIISDVVTPTAPPVQRRNPKLLTPGPLRRSKRLQSTPTEAESSGHKRQQLDNTVVVNNEQQLEHSILP